MPRTYVFTDYGGRDKEQLVDLPTPVPGEGQLLVKVRAAGVNPADWKLRANFRNSPDPVTSPRPMGLEVSGVVEDVGPGVTDFAAGDEVFGGVEANGGYSEYSLISTGFAAHKPAEVSFIEAATLSVAAATAYDGVVQTRLRPGDTLLVIGAGGGVGMAAVQIAVALGARVIGTASAQKRELVESLGATHVAYGPGVLERVRAAAPEGIAAIYDMVGGDACRELGALVTDGTRIVAAADPAAAAEFGGSRVSRVRESSVLEAVGAMASEGKLKVVISEVFPLERAGDALALVESGHATGKVVLEIG